MRWLRRLVLLGAVGALGALSPLAAFSADSGTVNAQVQAGINACILISSPASGGSVDFGNLAFSTQLNLSEGNGTPDITVTSCAATGQTLLASGTNATGTTANWLLVTQIGGATGCASGEVDTYRLALREEQAGGVDTFLTLNNQTVGSLTGPMQSITRTPRITMPCTGSSGNGQLMTMAYNFLATVP